MRAMEMEGAGGPYEWRNPASGHYGVIVPGPIYVERGARCRLRVSTLRQSKQPLLPSLLAQAGCCPVNLPADHRLEPTGVSRQ